MIYSKPPVYRGLFVILKIYLNIPYLGYCFKNVQLLPLLRFFIGYWILKQGWISIRALFLCLSLRLKPVNEIIMNKEQGIPNDD